MPRGKAGKGTKISKAAKRKKAFNIWDQERTPIKDGAGTFTPEKDEIFAQTKEKKYWFISNYGNLVSFYNPNNPKRIKPDETKRKRIRYNHKLEYHLIAEAFESYCYGLYNKIGGEIHHIRKYNIKKGKKYNCDPNYLEGVTEQVHKLLTKIQKMDFGEKSAIQAKELINIFTSLSKIASEENPDKATIVIADGEKETAIYSEEPETVLNALEKAKNWKETIYKHCMEQAHLLSLQDFVDSKEEDFFNNERYLDLTLISYNSNRKYRIYTEKIDLGDKYQIDTRAKSVDKIPDGVKPIEMVSFRK